jgi:hypothetical protein
MVKTMRFVRTTIALRLWEICGNKSSEVVHCRDKCNGRHAISCLNINTLQISAPNYEPEGREFESVQVRQCPIFHHTPSAALLNRRRPGPCGCESSVRLCVAHYAPATHTEQSIGRRISVRYNTTQQAALNFTCGIIRSARKCPAEGQSITLGSTFGYATPQRRDAKNGKSPG